MSDIRDFTGKNRKFTGTGGIKVPEGTTGQRVNTTGTFRFNSTTGRFEGFDGTNFATVIAYPTITSFTPALLTNDAGNIVITGLNFGTGNTASAFNISTASSVTANSTTIDSSTQITANFTIPVDGNYKIRVTTSEGAIGESAGTLVVSDVPVFSTSAGSLGNANANVAGSFTIAASESATFSLISGSLPPGYSLNSSTGVISGTDTVTVSDTTFSFTIQATDAQSQTATRAFSIFMDTFVATGGSVTTYGTAPAAYKVHTFTSPGGTLSVTGSRAMDILLVGAGGSGGGYHAGAGGAGGMVVLTGNTITAGSYPISVPGSTPNPAPNPGLAGGNTTGFGQTAVGGGLGGSNVVGGAGGSGGGGGAQNTFAGGAANQGAIVSPRTGTVHGNAGGSGGSGPGPSRHAGGGGGGAGGAGTNGGPGQDLGNGGVGLQNAFRTGSNEYYAGGGGGGAWDGQRGTGGSGGGGNGTRYNTNEADKNATFYGGGGGGNGGNGGPFTGGTGYEGVVVIRYLT